MDRHGCRPAAAGRVGEPSKLDLSVNAALSLTQIALYSGDRVGLLVYGRDVQQRVGLGGD